MDFVAESYLKKKKPAILKYELIKEKETIFEDIFRECIGKRADINY